LVHLSELSQKAVNNPNEVVRIGQKVKVKLILIDPKNRKIGLSMKDLDENKEAAPKASKKADLADIADKLEKEEAEKKTTRKPRAKKAEKEETEE
jgi:ribosomal protein S1